MNTIKNLFIIGLLLLITPVFAQISDESLKINPLLELFGSNPKTLGLKGNVTQMHEQQFLINSKGNVTGDSELINNFYKFYPEGSTKEFEQNYKYVLSKKHFFSYTNKGYISHIDIETVNVGKNKDTTETNLENETQTPDFSTADYKYVQKKNILYKGEEVIKSSPKKATTRNEYFYHFNDDNQIFQIDYQPTDLSTKYIYDSNALVKEVHTIKSGILSHKNIYKYDHNNRLIKIATINSDNNTKYPNKEIILTYKLDEKGNVIEKKMVTYLYNNKGTKEFLEGFLILYNYTYL